MVTVALASAKGIDRTWPGSIVTPKDQVLVVRWNFVGVDAVVCMLGFGGAAASENRILDRVVVTLKAHQITSTIVTCVTVALAKAERIWVAMVVVIVVFVVVLMFSFSLAARTMAISNVLQRSECRS